MLKDVIGIMTILKKLNDPRIKLSKSDRRLIEYFLKFGTQACSSSISEISDACNVSHATVTRFARKFEFETLKDFKIALAQDLGAQDSSNSLLTPSIDLKDSSEITAQKLLQLNVTMLTQSSHELDFTAVRNLVRYIISCKRVFFFGIGASGFIARDAARKFTRLGINTVNATDSHDMMMHASLVNKDDLCIFISTSGQTMEINKAARLAKQHSAKMAAITSDSSSALGRLCDTAVMHSVHESDLTSGYADSRLTVFFIIDLLFIEVIKVMGETALKNRKATAEAIDSLTKGVI